jgi:S1/P1 Nuclease
MKKLIILSLLIGSVFTAFGWGATGHRAVSLIADRHLNKKARLTLERILQGQPLAMTGTWMDDIRSDSLYDYAETWHYVTIDDNATYEQSKKSSTGDLIEALERIIAELKSKKLSAKEEAEKLKMLIHLIGDIHQPLHVGRNDQGGNSIKLTWFGSNSNLHRVWDSDMIDGSKLSYTELANALPKADAVRVKKLQGATVRDMAAEAMTFRNQIYAYGDGKLGYQYNYKNFNTVLDQISKAGIRLAGILNEIYGK